MNKLSSYQLITNEHVPHAQHTFNAIHSARVSVYGMTGAPSGEVRHLPCQLCATAQATAARTHDTHDMHDTHAHARTHARIGARNRWHPMVMYHVH